jgi:hypothetical protein
MVVGWFSTLLIHIISVILHWFQPKLFGKVQTRSLQFTECSCSFYSTLQYANASLTREKFNIKMDITETMWTGFIWLRIGTSIGVLGTQYFTSWCHKGGELLDHLSDYYLSRMNLLHADSQQEYGLWYFTDFTGLTFIYCRYKHIVAKLLTPQISQYSQKGLPVYWTNMHYNKNLPDNF